MNRRCAMSDETKKMKVSVPQVTTTNKIETFEKCEVRTALNSKGKLYFCVPDVVVALRDGKDAKDYIKKLRKRDPELNAKWNKLIKFISFQTTGGRQPIKFADAENLMRIIREVRSPKKEEFKKWVEQKIEESK